MNITPEQFEHIKHAFPVQRGNVRSENLQLLNAILYVAEHGCKWRDATELLSNLVYGHQAAFAVD